MEAFFAEVEQAFEEYRQGIENYQRKRRPTDGWLGFGRSMGDDPCNDRLDERIRRAVEGLCAQTPPPDVAEKMARRLLLRDDLAAWPLAAQWMLRAIERHALPLIPFLSTEDAAELSKAYSCRYKRWERLPAQKEICRALNARKG